MGREFQCPLFTRPSILPPRFDFRQGLGNRPKGERRFRGIGRDGVVAGIDGREDFIPGGSAIGGFEKGKEVFVQARPRDQCIGITDFQVGCKRIQ